MDMRQANKATHTGSCQVCGRVQKLPGNVLSKHGYTTKWGFFSGTCPGAHYKPFEVAFDRVQHSIDRTKAQVADLRAVIAGLQSAPVTDKAPYQAYDRMKGGYYETWVTVSREPIPSRPDLFVLILTEVKGQAEVRHHGNTHGLFGSIEDAVKKLRASRIGRLERDIQQREQYIAWQEKRIREWKPGILMPVKEAA